MGKQYKGVAFKRLQAKRLNLFFSRQHNVSLHHTGKQPNLKREGDDTRCTARHGRAVH